MQPKKISRSFSGAKVIAANDFIKHNLLIQHENYMYNRISNYIKWIITDYGIIQDTPQILKGSVIASHTIIVKSTAITHISRNNKTNIT